MSLRSLLLLSFFAFPAAADEMTVGWISRLPEIEYVWGSTDPTVEGWPASGQQVTWRANVRSWMDAPREVSYRWRVDGVETARGRVTIAPSGTTTVDFPWTWTFDRHRVTFEIDVDGEVAEESESNNTLTVFSDALSVGLWVEKSIYDHHRANQWRLRVGSTSFEDWAQRTIGYYNDMSALAIYPETPEGVHDRWRIQKIVIVDDDALPLSGYPAEVTPGATGNSHPDISDRTVDLMWGFRAATLGGYKNLTTARPSNAFYLSLVVLHEMSHARYLTDVYAWNVRHSPPDFTIAIREDGSPIVGNYVNSGYAFRTPEQGLMNETEGFLDRYSAAALNLIRGRRATEGNYNEPRNFATFINDLPAQNRVTIRDGEGNLMTDADVKIYWSVANTNAWYGTQYDDVPDMVLHTDGNGQVLVGRSPFASDGQVVQTFGNMNGTAVVRVEKDDVVRYGFLESRLFNLAYWRGETDFADHDLVVGPNRCSAAGPQITSPSWDAQMPTLAHLAWTGISGATGYRIWASSNLQPPRVVATATTQRSVDVPLTGLVYWWVEAELPGCGPRRSETGRFLAPQSSRRRAVAH